MTFENLVASVWIFACRLASYATQNLADDAAMLALLFC